jgi:hypothetical protein
MIQLIMRPQFRQSIADYRWFLEKGYPKKSSLQMVTTRHSLNASERSMLFRGIMKTADANRRKEKIISLKEIQKQEVHIDAFNVILTVIAYLNGDKVFISDDGLLRDASENHGKEIDVFLIERSAHLCVESLRSKKIEQCLFYIDQKLAECALLEFLLRVEISRTRIKSEFIRVKSADHILKKLPDIISATSDGDIIDSGNHKVFDLARYILRSNFSPDFLNLNKF